MTTIRLVWSGASVGSGVYVAGGRTSARTWLVSAFARATGAVDGTTAYTLDKGYRLVVDSDPVLAVQERYKFRY